ncbi:MAG: carboxylating nicotinate-nucleotide diphosphorylase [Candidatus Cloacimonetes bacterium]|nr:carboxylating nicotinate-nucleotide diphosphorylase [Candidatus Cloacimonadota bacterium]
MDIDKLIEEALLEDLQMEGDITSQAIFSDEQDNFYLQAKENGVLCGLAYFVKVFHSVDPDIQIELKFSDGDKVKPNELIATLQGKVRSILIAERTALNLLSHLSGITSKTAKFVQEAGGRSVILDTRKTLPGYRNFHKYAVLCGGASNHRMGLYDMVMIKDNHIDAAGGIAEAIRKVRDKWGHKYKIEVEVRDLSEVKTAVKNKADRIMLDNMNLKEMKKAVEIIKAQAETEASGNMTLNRISQVAETGVDFISVGELTHSVKALDLSIKRGKNDK